MYLYLTYKIKKHEYFDVFLTWESLLEFIENKKIKDYHVEVCR